MGYVEMSITKADLENFNRFASEKVKQGAADSIVDLAAEWQAVRERAEVNSAIRRGIDEMNAGLGRPADEALDDYRRKYDIPKQ